ncbi:peptide ABC transporter substrate-binding protein [Caryophanon latum]|uniref:ABC transporter substrate-binding protein n=1 Tax=Caryophanon latum TaxID=33977 RepID=A0A1C0Z4Z0_9BACL|nr:peptide ABC transporter substrate-binding protein [Caryophanon latum]OCS94466.1 ABC transporter substrate-binding protein [Caryophanon latum]
MKKNNFLVLMMLLLLSVVLVACNFGGEEETTDDSGTTTDTDTTTDDSSGGDKELNLVVASEPPSLHPQLATDTTSSTIMSSTHEGLMTLKNGEPVPGVAESYKMSDDQLTYTFTLRDAKWSNGEPVTAEDFAYAWEFALNPANASEYATILYAIKGAEAYNLGTTTSFDEVGVKVIDSKTLEVTLESPTPYFLELTAFKTLYPIHKATAEANPKWYTEADTYVGNGAFVLSQWQHAGSLTLEKNPEYWDADNVKLTKVNIEMVESETTQMTKFESGEIDFLGTNYGKISLDAIERLQSEESLNIVDYSGIYWYKFNTTDDVMKNANIRKALTLAIDRAGLIKNVTKGEEEPALGMVPNGVEGFGDDAGFFKDADYEGAKAALDAGLKELGLSDPSELNLKLSFNTSDAHAVIAQYIQEGWNKNLGINVTLENAEWQVYLDKLSSLDYQIGRLGWIADYNDAYSFLEMYNSADNGNNDTGWSNEEYTNLLKQSTTETDPAARLDLLKKAEEIIIAEFPVAPIYYYTNLYVVKDYVTGMEPDNLGNINLKDVDVTK